MKILIGGDVVPTAVNAELFKKGDLDALMGKELRKIWEDADFRMINLEAPADAFAGIPKLNLSLVALQ
jgi:hypothetical protein